ncbi:O-antigen ligase family protein [Pseudomonas sp. MSSRFD41]|uniref:O-antigen ligase family protein n=1 Tax=Pseudomonas sp. MSSRFD41 TaxID=1310370 RepID=UPI00163B1262|nr:O-antigen ligase family protein [Pseudomonas sp. MSSRFD41]MBC2657555.1 O-antigen ligase family protein [Pseudomonas sp. MSSRFD41]
MIAAPVLGLFLGLAALALLASPWPFLAPLVVVGLAGLAVLYRRPGWGLLGICALVPFEGLFKDSAFSGAKLLGASLILIMLFKLLLRQVPDTRLGSNLWRALGPFLLFLLLSFMYSENLAVSLDSLRELAVGLVLFFVTLLIARDTNLLMLCRLLAVSVAITCVIALVSAKYQVGGRAIGLLQDANYFALLIAMAVPLAILLALRAPCWPLRLFWIVIGLTLMAGMTKTDSRSGLLVVLFTVAIGAWHYRDRLKGLRPKHLGFAMFAVAIVVPLGIAALPADYVARIKSLGMLKSGAHSEDTSLGRRTSYLVVGGQMIRDNPLLGSGLGTFPVHYAQTGFASGFSENLNEPDLYRRAHNTYLELFSELGIPAGLSFVALMLMGLRNFERARQAFLARGVREQADLATHLGLSLLALAVFLLFLSAPNHKYLWIFLALSSVLRRQAEDDQ